jgi:hypothetical protein
VSVPNTRNLTINGALTILPSAARASGQLIINPGGSVTVIGATLLNAPQQIQILASSTGVGSFIDNGTITYGASGSAMVQTYIKNDSAVGTFHAHLVGPTISDPAFETAFSGLKGVFLSAFNLAASSTYAYNYVESTNTWNNIYNNNIPVLSGLGILLSTTDGTDHTMSMTGNLVTGAYTPSGALGHTGNNLALLSNPYASSLFFDAFHAANSSTINNVYRLFNAQNGNYLFYSISGGGTLSANIQVGQGFFVETLQASTVTFNNSMRVHSNAPFYKDGFANQLRLDAEGTNGFKDATFVYFNDAGTPNFDQSWDVYKWWSMNTEATELWTVSNDQAVLSMNTLPTLGGEMVSVPLSFKCGEAGEYTITASQLESFDQGTEVWLEDIQTGEPWHNFNANPVYEFAGSALGMQNRFIVHFFGPTGIGDPEARNAVQIYGFHKDAYIVNHGSQTIKEYFVYDMMGRELQSGSLPNSTVNKITIGDVSAYYIVKVITKEGGVYKDKVFITE